MGNHQRVNAPSNAHVGREFEQEALRYFREHEGLVLSASVTVPIGIAGNLKAHRFDLGADDPPVLVECKSHTWTETGNMPSAKVTVWNEAMYYFLLAPPRYRKILFVLEARHQAQRESLAEYYVRTNGHLIPPGVSIMEYNPVAGTARAVVQGPGARPARSQTFKAISVGGGGDEVQDGTAAQAQLSGYTIRQLHSGTIQVIRDGVLQATAKPLLREFATRLGISINNGQGNAMNTRQLGAAVIRAASVAGDHRT